MANKAPTNGNIMDAVMSLTKDVAKNRAVQDARHEQYSDEFKSIETRQNYTNGNVKDLLLWQSNMKAVDDYKKTQEAQVGTNLKVSGWDWKAYLALLATIATILAGILGTAVK
jgi:hypothetical protein